MAVDLTATPLADAGHVEASLGRRLTDTELTQVPSALRIVSAVIRQHYTLPATLPDVVADVAGAAAARLLTAPAPGVTQEQVGSYSVTYDAAGGLGLLTAVEQAALRSLLTRARLGTITTPADPIAQIMSPVSDSWWGGQK